MKNWTPDASNHFEAWLGRVRLSVAGDPSLDADDIAQDLRAHVHAELETISEPVTVGALEQVLDSLGNPSQWSDTIPQPAGAAPAPWFERHVTQVLAGWQQRLAGDWGLPVLVFVLTLVAIPTFDTLGAPLLVFAYFVARGHVTYASHHMVGRKRWLVYAPLAVGAGMLAGLVLGFPVVLNGGYQGRLETIWTLGSWWVLVGILAAREPKRVRAALRPFADGFEATHARMLALIGGAFLITSSVILLAR